MANVNERHPSVARIPKIERANVFPTNFEDRAGRNPSSSSTVVSIGMLQFQGEFDTTSSRRISSSSSLTPCFEEDGEVAAAKPSELISESGTSLIDKTREENYARTTEQFVEELEEVFEEHPLEDSTLDTIFIDKDFNMMDHHRNANNCNVTKIEELQKCGRDESSDSMKNTSEVSETGKSLKSVGGVTSPRTRPRSETQMTINWRPVMPGYKDIQNGGSAVIIQRALEVNSYDGSLRDSIPAMPKVLAIICFVFNVITPGLGTLFAGLSVLCCSRIRGGGDKVSVIWINTCVTLLQIITTPLFLLGWIWSILWGMSFLSFADDSYECQCLCKPESGEQESNCDVTAGEEQRDDTSQHHRRATHSATSNTTASLHDNEMVGVEDGHTSCNSHTDQVAIAPPPQPMIVLQETPVVLHHTPRNSERRGSMQVHRSSRQYGRQNRSESLPHVLLDPQTLENIITRNGAIPAIFRSERESEEHIKSPFSVT